MIRVSVEIINGGARYELAVRAESIERAVRLAGRRYPGCVARVLFPIDPESFFAQADVQPGRTISVDAPKEAVGYAGAGRDLRKLAPDTCVHGRREPSPRGSYGVGGRQTHAALAAHGRANEADGPGSGKPKS